MSDNTTKLGAEDSAKVIADMLDALDMRANVAQAQGREHSASLNRAQHNAVKAQQARIAELEAEVREYHREQQELQALLDKQARERARTTVPFSIAWDTVVAALQTHIDSLRECADPSLAEPLRDAEQTLARLREEELRTWRQDEEVTAASARIAELEAIFAASHDTLAQRDNRIADLEAQLLATQRAFTAAVVTLENIHDSTDNPGELYRIRQYFGHFEEQVIAARAAVAQADGKEAV